VSQKYYTKSKLEEMREDISFFFRKWIENESDSERARQYDIRYRFLLCKFYEIMHNDLKTTVSPARDILSRAAAMLASGSDINEIGNICDDYFRLLGRQLKATKKQIAGNVVQVDHFGNLITNIEQDIFVMLHKERPFHIKFGKEVLRKIHRTYASVEPGECFVVFNSLGLLEIGINKGNASELLGLGYDSPVFINFEQDT